LNDFGLADVCADHDPFDADPVVGGCIDEDSGHDENFVLYSRLGMMDRLGRCLVGRRRVHHNPPRRGGGGRPALDSTALLGFQFLRFPHQPLDQEVA
jgi:hypothetical protein